MTIEEIVGRNGWRRSVFRGLVLILGHFTIIRFRTHTSSHTLPGPYVYSISKTTTDFVGSVVVKMLPSSLKLLKIVGFTT